MPEIRAVRHDAVLAHSMYRPRNHVIQARPRITGDPDPWTGSDQTPLLPGFSLQIAFDHGANGEPTPTQWTELWGRVREDQALQITRGRSDPLRQFDAGTFDVVLSNDDGELDPANTTGAWFGKLRPMRHIRMRARLGLTKHDMFRGFIPEWRPQYDWPNDCVMPIRASDLFLPLNLATVKNSAIYEHIALAPISYWPLDEVSGPFLDRGPEALSVDSTGADLGQGGPSVGGARSVTHFPSTYLSTAIDAPDSLLIAGTLTISFWAKLDNISANGTVFTVAGGDISAFSLELYYTPTTVYPRFQHRVSADRRGIAIFTPVSHDLAWHHYAITRTGDGRVSFIFDGVPQGPSIVEAGAAATTEVQASGDQPQTVNLPYSLNATVAHIAIFDRVLTVATVQALIGAAVDSFPAEPAGVRVGKVLGWSGVPAPLTSVDTGNSTLQARDARNETVLSLCQQAAQSENGEFFVDGAGRATFRGRWWRSVNRSASAGTFGSDIAEITYLEVQPASPDRWIINTIVVTRDGGSSQNALDITSQGEFGQRSHSQSVITSDDDAESLANWILNTHKDPVHAPWSITLIPGEDMAVWAHVLAREIGDRITVVVRPPNGTTALTSAVNIDGITHRYQGRRWITTWQLVPADLTNGWILGDVTLSILGSTTRLGW